MSVPGSLLGGLGKATRRGVRKCPKCNTVNGTRGLSCKNKSCDYVFKEPNPDGKKLICPSVVPGSLYSVRHSSSVRAFIYRSEGTCYCTECGYGPCKRLSPIPPSSSSSSSEQEALPFTLKVSVLNSLSIPDSLKHEIYSRAKEPGPLVQRVSRSWMVVKKSSQEESLFPLVHIRFGVKFYSCSCSDNANKCFHFLASLAVFAGDPLLSKEFARFMALLSDPVAMPPSLLSIQDQNGETLQVSLVEEEDLHQELNMLSAALDESAGVLSMEEAKETLPVSLPGDLLGSSSTSSTLFQSLLSSQSSNSPSKHLKKSSGDTKEGGGFTFLEWLAGVTEKINQSMQFQFSGQASPIVFQAPQTFFNQLRDRISSTTKESCPCVTSTTLRRDTLPLGTFTKYTWRLTNIFHVKDIFDTDLVPLDITRNFVQNKDGSFDLVTPETVTNKRSLLITNNNNNTSLSMRQSEFKTYLKVGQMSAHSRDCVPFIIEWIPDILPIMKVGELTIIFEYGHNKNGTLQDNLRLIQPSPS